MVAEQTQSKKIIIEWIDETKTSKLKSRIYESKTEKNQKNVRFFLVLHIFNNNNHRLNSVRQTNLKKKKLQNETKSIPEVVTSA